MDYGISGKIWVTFARVEFSQDHLTKFAMLRALKSKKAEEVAERLIEIFAILGSPRLLHTDNGKEFDNDVIRCVCKDWPECKPVRGKPRHSQSQGSVERCNRDVEVKKL